MASIPSKEDLQRMQIPTRSQLTTKYNPVRNYLMVIPLPDQNMTTGGLHLPDRHTIEVLEGHVVEKGPLCSAEIEVGDCITWIKSTAVKCEWDETIPHEVILLVPESGVLMRIPNRVLTLVLKGELLSETGVEIPSGWSLRAGNVFVRRIDMVFNEDTDQFEKPGKFDVGRDIKDYLCVIEKSKLQSAEEVAQEAFDNGFVPEETCMHGVHLSKDCAECDNGDDN